jgi:hypothetical protein
MTNLQNLDQILSTLPSGVTPTIKVLKTRGPRKGELVCERVGGAKTAYRPSIKMGNGGNRHIKG